MLLLRAFTCVCVFSVAVTTETVVGVAGQAVALPCGSEAAARRELEVCWGRGQPTLLGCHDTLTAGAYRKSPRFSVSPSSSLNISDSRPSDSGFYHCRVQLPGPFNDQTSSVHLIVIHPRPLSSASERSVDGGNLNAPRTTTGGSILRWPDDDVTGNDALAAAETSVQQQSSEDALHMFVGNTVRLSFIVFVPALLLTAAYRVWRNRTEPQAEPGRPDQSEEEAGSAV